MEKTKGTLLPDQPGPGARRTALYHPNTVHPVASPRKEIWKRRCDLVRISRQYSCCTLKMFNFGNWVVSCWGHIVKRFPTIFRFYKSLYTGQSQSLRPYGRCVVSQFLFGDMMLNNFFSLNHFDRLLQNAKWLLYQYHLQHLENTLHGYISRILYTITPQVHFARPRLKHTLHEGCHKDVQ